MTTDLSGQVIKGYRLQQRIGQGRFAVVYHASQPQMHRDVAIKVIDREYANHPEFVRSFESEAQLIARLEHIHIVPLYDYWREPDRAFLVMRWLRGGSLRDVLAAQGPLPLDTVTHLLDQVVSALMLAHRKNVVHRDVKPDNILLDEEGNAFLTDFGIAATVHPDTANTRETRLFGTPAYMAPELFSGTPATPQTDIYALGVMLYEMLTNVRPFPDDTTENLMRQHIAAPVPSLQVAGTTLPQELNFVIWRATAKSPDARFSNALELASAFRTAALSQSGQQAEKKPLAIPTYDAADPPTRTTTLIIDHPLQLDNPYKGLRPFEQADAVDFFGRETLVAQLLARLNAGGSRFLALVGPSGSGKSSVVKAGLIPALRAGQLGGASDWFTVEMVPGTEPFRALEAALQRIAVNPMEDMLARLTADPQALTDIVTYILPQERPTQLLLVIDQFEEVFTQVESEAVRKAFLASLTTAVKAAGGRLHVIITLRADHYDRPLLYEGFGALMRECSEVILPLTAQELRQAIENPAGRLGLIVEAELVTTIVADVSQQPGALPLLQYALTEVFEHRHQHVLTLEAYRKVGGITAALARRAEAIYMDLDPDSQELTRQLFLRLVRLDDESEATRRRLVWSSLTTLSDDQELIEQIRDTFVQARLLTVDHDPKTREPTVEVAHEALIRAWDRLVGWLEASREDIHMQRRLNLVASEWHGANRDPGFLLTNTRLIQFDEWASTANLHLTREERDFLAASLEEREARLAAEQARLAREKMLERRTRNWLIALVAVFAIAAIAGFLIARYAIRQQGIAEDRLHALRINNITDQASLALEDDNPELALALLHAIDEPLESLPLQTQQVHYRAAYAPGTKLVYRQHGDAVLSIAISPDGTLAASGSGRINPIGASTDNALSIWDPMTGHELYHLTAAKGGHTDTVTGVAFSPDGQLLASASADRTIILWDTTNGTVKHRLEGHTDWVVRVAFSPDGKTLLSTSGNFLLTALPIPLPPSDDTSVRLWDVTTGEALRIFGGEDGGHTAPVMSLAFSPDGQQAVTGDADGVIILWDVTTGTEIRRMTSPGDWVSSLAYIPDGSQFLAALGKPSVGGSGATSTLMAAFDPATGTRLRDYTGHTNVVISVAVSPDGRTALTGSADTSMRLWDIETATELHRFTGHDDWVFGVAFGPDARWAISASADMTLRVWDIESGNLEQRFATADLPLIRSIDLSKDVNVALSGHADGVIMLWDTKTGREIRQFTNKSTSNIMSVAFNADHTQAATGALDGQVTLWDVATGTAIRHFEGHTNAVLNLAFSPDGSRLVTASGNTERDTEEGDDNTARVWDVATGEELICQEHPDSVWGVDFSPDGRWIVSSSGPLFASSGTHMIRVWDAETGAIVAELKGHTDLASSVAFGPEGRTVISGSEDRTARLWDIAQEKEIRRFEGHTGFINTVIIDPDNMIMFSGSDDDTIRLWDVATGAELYRIEDHHDTIQDMDLSGDGRYLLAVSANNIMLLWRVDRDMEELAAWTDANRYVRDLTCTERDNFRIEPLCEVADDTGDQEPTP